MELIPYDPKGQHKGWRGRELLAANLRARKFDVAFSLCKTHLMRHGWLGVPGFPERD